MSRLGEAQLNTTPSATTHDLSPIVLSAWHRWLRTSAGAVKAVKAVDPAIILQRRDAVQQRVLKLESKLAKDRALLAKYSVPYLPSGPAAGTSGEEEEEEDHTAKTANA